MCKIIKIRTASKNDKELYIKMLKDIEISKTQKIIDEDSCTIYYDIKTQMIAYKDCHCDIEHKTFNDLKAITVEDFYHNCKTDYNIYFFEDEEKIKDLYVKWFDKQFYNEDNEYTWIQAAIKNNLNALKWLHENRSGECTKYIMDFAASYGSLDAVKWLHFNRKEGCTTNAMDFAAMNGHLDVIKFLHFNRKEGCTTDAMDWAAKNGYLSIVKWLHENRKEGCTTDAMDYVLKNNHLGLAKWMYSNRKERYTQEMMEHVLDNGHPDMVKWLTSLNKPKRIHTSTSKEFNYDKVITELKSKLNYIFPQRTT